MQILAPTAATVIDGSLAVWSFGAVASGGYYILKNGAIAASGSGVLIGILSNVIYIWNKAGNWYKWTGSAWQQVPSNPFPNPPPSPPTCSVSISPAVVVPPQTATLSWSSVGADSVTVTGQTNPAASGSVTIAPTDNAIYSITATNKLGSATASATITAIAPPANPGLVPSFPINQTSPDYANLIKYAGSSNPANYNIGGLMVAMAWLADGKRNNSMRDFVMAQVRTLLSSAMTKWNAGQNVTDFSRDDYLYAGSSVWLLTTAASWMLDQFTADELYQVSLLCGQTVWNLWNKDQANWNGVKYPWSGWALNDPVNNYFQRTHLPATMLWAIYSGKQTWLDKLHNSLIPAMAAGFNAIVGGGSPEGTGYGQFVTRALQNAYLYKAAFGIDITPSLRIGEIADYWVNCITPDFKTFAMIGDNNLAPVGHYHRTIFTWCANLVPTDPAAARARYMLTKIAGDDVPYLWENAIDTNGTAQAPTAKNYFASYLGQVFARDDAGAHLTMECGYNIQSHAHFSQTQTQLYLGGKFREVAATAAATSGNDQKTEWCNVVVFYKADGVTVVEQHKDNCATTVTDDGNFLTATADATKAYSGTDVAGCWRVMTWDRSIRKRTTHDTFTTQNGVTGIWQSSFLDQPVLQADGSYVAGPLTIRCLTPGATSDVIDWDATPMGWDFPPGKCWRLRFRGTTEYVVETTW